MSVDIKTLRDGVAVAFITGEHVAAIWEDVQPGLEQALDESDNEVTAETVYAMIAGGHWVCWALSEDNELEGFGVGETIHSAKGMWLNVPFAWVDKNLRILNHLMHEIESYAEANEYYGVKFYSSKVAFQRWADRRGYKTRFIESIRVIGEKEFEDG